MKQSFARALMMSWIASLAACGPEMAADEEELAVLEEPAVDLQKELAPLKEVQVLNLADCTSSYSLSNGTARTGLSGAEKAWSCIYTLSVPSGATDLKFWTSGSTGDADLYVKYGAVPTDLSNDCKSAGSTSTETCTMSSTQAGTYYVRVYAYSAYSGLSLSGSYTGGNPPSTGSCNSTYSLSNGTPRSGVSAGSRYWSCIYTLSVPAGATNLRFDTIGGTGDADLYVQHGSVPTESLYACRSAGSNSNESCQIAYIQPGTYYVRLFGYSAASGITLTGSYTPGNQPPSSCTTTYTLTNGTTRTGLSAAEKAWSCIYMLYVPSNATSVTFETSGGTGDADLFVKSGTTPTDSSYDCKSAGTSNSETCTLTNLQAGTYYYVRLYGYSAASSVSLVGRYQ